MKYSLFFFISLGFYVIASGQDNSVSLADYSRKDSVRLRLLLETGTELVHNYPDSAKTYLKEALALATTLKDTLSEARSKRAMAAYYILKSDYDTALPLILEAAPILEQYGNAYEVRSALGNLAIIYGRKNDLEKSLEIWKKIVAQIEKESSKPEHVGLYYNFAENHRKLGNFTEAEKYYLEVLALSRNFNIDFGIVNALTALAVLYTDHNKNAKAGVYINAALAHADSVSNPGLLAISQGIATRVYMGLKQYENVITASREALTYYKQAGNRARVSALYATIANASRKLGDYKTADEYGVKYQELKDSLFDLERMKAMEDLTVKYETEKIAREKQLAELEADRNGKYLMGAIALGGLLLLSLGLYFLSYKNKKNAQMAKQQLRSTEKELNLEKRYRASELKALKAQMNPHFMFNAMNSIQSLILRGDRDEAYNYLAKFSALLRENLNISEKNFIYFHEEAEMITTYMELEKLRLRSDFEYHITGAEAIEDIRIPAMIIQPFVENAIKHGLSHKEGRKKLSIDFRQNGTLQCSITDNGIGRKASEAINKNRKGRHTSFSTGAMEKRFALLCEYYKMDLGFSYTDLEENNSPAGTRVILKIPYLADDD